MDYLNYFLSVIIALDVRVENFFYAFRDLELVKFFIWITLLAKWQIVASSALAAILVLWLWGKKTYIIPLLAVVSGGGLFNLIGKSVLHRERPETALYSESTFSFPSGHSTVAVAFFGFIIYILMRGGLKLKYKIGILFFGAVLILLVGLSRLYLGVHFLSDVLGGYLLGLFWLIIGIIIAERLNFNGKISSYRPSREVKILSAVIIFVQIAFYVGFALDYNLPVNETAPKDINKNI